MEPSQQKLGEKWGLGALRSEREPPGPVDNRRLGGFPIRRP
jgi:hypothetical protein